MQGCGDMVWKNSVSSFLKIAKQSDSLWNKTVPESSSPGASDKQMAAAKCYWFGEGWLS